MRAGAVDVRVKIGADVIWLDGVEDRPEKGGKSSTLAGVLRGKVVECSRFGAERYGKMFAARGWTVRVVPESWERQRGA